MKLMMAMMTQLVPTTRPCYVCVVHDAVDEVDVAVDDGWQLMIMTQETRTRTLVIPILALYQLYKKGVLILCSLKGR